MSPASRSESLLVPMRDGVTLSVHLHRPAKGAPVPAILMVTPYHKGPLGGPHPFVSRGYAMLTADIRGTGSSGGSSNSIYSADERQDAVDLIQWIARQPWCSGSVGMWGISYGAVAALQAAVAAPPALKAIIARSGSDDPYTEWTNPGGSPRPYMHTCYGPLMDALNLLPPRPEDVGAQWASLWRERLEKTEPWSLGFVRNMVDGPYWRERSMRGRYDRVRCAVFVVDGWADWYHSPLLRIFASVKTPHRALIGPWSHEWPDRAFPGPNIDWDREALRWFDRHLKGLRNGVDREPPVTVFVRDYSEPKTLLPLDAGRFRAERAWPPPGTRQTRFYLGPAGGLSIRKPGGSAPASDTHAYDPRIGRQAGFHGGGPFNANWAMPLDQRPDEIHSLVYTTAPLPKPVEVIGQPRATLFVSSTAATALFCVKLCDVAPDGTSVLVTKGWLNGTHRESHTDPSPLVPGRVYELDVELLTCAYRFAAGHRIRIDVASSDYLNVWPTPLAARNTVYRDVARPSHVVLPVAPAEGRGHPKPAVRRLKAEADRPLPEAPELTFTEDRIRETETAAFRVRYGALAELTGSFEVSARDPARTVATAEVTAGQASPGGELALRLRAVTASDATAFHHTLNAEIDLGGRPYFRKEWAVSVPRRGA